MIAVTVVTFLQHALGLDVSGEAEFCWNRRIDTERQKVQAEQRRVEERIAELEDQLAQLTEIRPKATSKKPRSKELRGVGNELLLVAPGTLYFPLPLDKFILNTLTASNLSDHHLLFKLKATAPTRYAVRPRQGVLRPRESLELNVTLRPTEDDPDQLRDKFLIEARTLAEEEVDALSNVEDVTIFVAELLTRSPFDCRVKLRCVFPKQLPDRLVAKSLGDSSGLSHHQQSCRPTVPVWDAVTTSMPTPTPAPSEAYCIRDTCTHPRAAHCRDGAVGDSHQ
eukprot:GGOE01045167.1.p1 GENE.GGOE01045167.1~~GGOE01045167.1.p1  ORF type:complete len:311 (+),score=66.94 GGOE01045167.1:92-934(+)